ncbi:protein of unknown function [Burkholderia multivorans]
MGQRRADLSRRPADRRARGRLRRARRAGAGERGGRVLTGRRRQPIFVRAATGARIRNRALHGTRMSAQAPNPVDTGVKR